MFNNNQYNYSIDSPFIHRDSIDRKYLPDPNNREIKQIGNLALQQVKTINTNSEQYKYLIRVAEISSRVNLVDKNEKLLDDIIEELSILMTLESKSKTIQSFLSRLYQLFKKKKRLQTNIDNKNRENALLNNKYLEKPRISTNCQQSLSPHCIAIKARPLQNSEPKYQINVDCSVRNYQVMPSSTKREQINFLKQF